MAVKRTSKRSAAATVGKQLERYRSMRDFAVTREPEGTGRKKTASSALPFVVQKHAATYLHYDFRLGWNGVLKSWAVAKGPSYSTSEKRLAVEVEDHPLEYGGFEGIIPHGQYGGGTVMLWDTGTWEPQAGSTDVDAALKEGRLKFILHGTKLKGAWALIRMNGKAGGKGKPNWLLIKEHDSFERAVEDSDILEEEPSSVITGRNLKEIASSGDLVWDSEKGSSNRSTPDETAGLNSGSIASAGDSAGTGRKLRTKPALTRSDPSSIREGMDSLPKERLPKFIPPQLASKVDEPPTGDTWLHELKLDGYRIEAHKSGSAVHLYTRTGLDWTHRMKSIVKQVENLTAETLILDGEVVVVAKDGTTSFADLQASLHEDETYPLTYFVFDLLHLDGRNLRNLPLLERKAILASLLDAAGTEIRLSEHVEGDAKPFFQAACKHHVEGIVSKLAAGRYISGRTAQWVKLKCIYTQEFVIGGFTLPANGIEGVGALLLGVYDDAGKLKYAGRTGTGFTRKTHRTIRLALDGIRVKRSPFESIPASAHRGVIWVNPALVAQVNFATWTADNLVRQAAFKGLREDKPAKEVRRESSIPPPRSNAPTTTIIRRRVSTQTAAKVIQPAPAKAREDNPEDAHPPIRLTHPDKVLDPVSGLTKQQLADYFWQISEHMLSQIADRPLSLVRCPQGSSKPCFFQKHVNDNVPPGIETIQIADKKTGETEPYITLSTREALAGLAQMGVLEVHPWGSRNGDLEHPDRIIFDLDPGENVSWATLAASTDETRKLLKKVGLESFLKSTGGKGLHVVAPILPEYDWSVVKQFALLFATTLEQRNPSLYITRMNKADRKGRIFMDYLRNDRGSTAVAAFSPRARSGAPVSIPLSWSELKLPAAPLFHIADFTSWKSRLKRDPWSQLPYARQSLIPERLEVLHPFA
jgi:bifunctional non-homologous end joining protein LigD